MFSLFNERHKKMIPGGFLGCLLMVSVLGGCAITTINTMHNAPLPLEAEYLQPTRASQSLRVDDLPNGVFIGIALSGGGSRAANFSIAALLELERLGILQNTSVISSVSGSSLVAAYYGLYGCDKKRWKQAALRETFRTDFELPWIGRWFNPWNIVRYWFTNLNRSDIMVQELDSDLFDDQQFKNMCQTHQNRPRILINATSFNSGQQFIFSDEQFKASLNSRLDTYPIARAVMASSSFPVVFHDITLKDYHVKGEAFKGDNRRDETENFEHLIDGGPSDNLGVTPLVNVVKTLYQNPQKQPQACFLFVIDASPHQQLSNAAQLVDTRHWYDFILDTNVATSSDVLLTTNRENLLQALGINVKPVDLNPYIPARDKAWAKPIEHCNIWHLTFQRLSAPSFETIIAGGQETDDYRHLLQLRHVVNATPTRYKLTGVESYSPESVQDYLFKAANLLIKNDQFKKADNTSQFIFKDVIERMRIYLKNIKSE
ncbi:MAG: patatin-like phospholipase family protein [Methylococcaceae bacterium]|nr:patatin-like phospholipase family protein [Methylococcaceae bacterium]